MRTMVLNGYEQNRYAETFRYDPQPAPWETAHLAAFCEGLLPGAQLLDLGSGPGVPFDRWLVQRGYRLTGVEFASRMIAQARSNVPEARYLQADMLEVVLPEAAFGGVLCLYAFFHLPRTWHDEMLARIARWLAPGGRLLITLGARAMEGDVEQDWCGAPMIWSSHAPDTYPPRFANAGLQILEQWQEGSPGDEEHHLWILAERGKETTC